MDDTTVEATGEERLAAALAPFGWTCTDAFWQRYYSDAWVFNLANAVERLSAAALPDPRPTEAEAYDGYRGEVPVIGWDMWEYLRDLGCFRPEPAAEPPVDAPPEPERPTTGPHESVTDRSTPVAPLDTPQGGQL